MSNFQLYKKAISATGTTTENEPVIKSDAASSDVMEWQASTGTSKVEIREDASNNLKLEVDGIPVASGLAGIDGQGLHFDGAAGNIDIASPPDLGTKFSFEFIVQADSWPASGSNIYIVDFGNGGRFVLGNPTTGNFSVRSVTGDWLSFGSAVLDDLKVHHVVVTVDGTSAIAYDNGNQIGTATITSPNIGSCADARIGSDYVGTASFFNGTLYRARFWNKTLKPAEVTASYENATVPFADQYGSQTAKITGDSSTFASGLGTWTTGNTWNSQTNPSNNMVLSATATDQRCYGDFGMQIPSTGGAKKYRFTYDASAITGTVTLRGWDGDYVVLGAFVAGTAQTIEFDTSVVTLDRLYISAGASGDAITLDNLGLVQIGAVADYDLAFANPTQSNQIQDRSTNGVDGTKKPDTSGGVTQVTPIEQVNTNKLSVGGTTPRVGIGLVAGTAPSTYVDSSGAGIDVDGLYTAARFKATDVAATGLQLVDNAGKVALTTSSGSLEIWTDNQTDGNSFVAGDKAVTIDTAGNVGIGVSDPSSYYADGNNLVVGNTSSSNGISIISGTANTGNVFFGDGTGTSTYRGYLGYNHSDDSIYLATAAAHRLTISSAGLATFSNGINVSAGDLGVGTTNPDAGTNAPTARSSVGRLNTYTGTTASIADSGTLDIPLTMQLGLMAYLVESNANSGHMSAGFFRSNNDGANSAFTFFGQSEYNVAVTHPSAGNIRITNNTGGATTFFYAITVIAG